MVVACPVRNFENDTSQEQISLKKQGGRFGCRAKSKTCNQKTEKHDQKSTEIINMTTNGIFTLYTILPSTGNVFSLSLYFFGFFPSFLLIHAQNLGKGKLQVENLPSLWNDTQDWLVKRKTNYVNSFKCITGLRPVARSLWRPGPA
jgi:hypothetical protein